MIRVGYVGFNSFLGSFRAAVIRVGYLEFDARPVRRRFTGACKYPIPAETDSAQGSGAIGRIIRCEGLYSSHQARSGAGERCSRPM